MESFVEVLLRIGKLVEIKIEVEEVFLIIEGMKEGFSLLIGCNILGEK